MLECYSVHIGYFGEAYAWFFEVLVVVCISIRERMHQDQSAEWTKAAFRIASREQEQMLGERKLVREF